MTREFGVKYTCAQCGNQTTAETGFGRWMRHIPKLDSAEGIVRTDTDHWVLRYMTSAWGRDFQFLMLVEVKEHGAEPRPDQLDVLRFVHVGIVRRGWNMHGARTCPTWKAKSEITGRVVNVRYYGYHLLQFEKTNPKDSAWIRWDRKTVDCATLIGILAMERSPDYPFGWMNERLRDRHRKDQTLLPLPL